jgi:hypothetical protein
MQGQHSLACQAEGRAPLEAMTDTTLIERVNRLVQAREAPPEWRSSHLSVTPTSLAVEDLAAQVEALQQAVQEIALEVQRLSQAEGPEPD